jgi:starch synthase
MYIVQISSEIAPAAKVGGLADVVYGLSRELEVRGNAVEVILPKYDCIWYDQIWGLTRSYEDLWVPWYGGAICCTVWFGFVHGRKVFFIEPHSQDNFFNRGVFYGQHDDVLRFTFFSRAALEFLLKSGKRPDIIHCHDWQTAPVPVLLYEVYQALGMDRQRVCFTVHNFRHQGLTGAYWVWAAAVGRPEHFFDHTRMGDNHHHGALNLMKGAIVYSNFVNTVSPHHAWEARFTDQGCGLQPTLDVHQGKFGGVLNGCDYQMWDPQTDGELVQNYSVETLDRKYANKDALRERLMMRKEFKPLVAYVGRLDHQKGVQQIRHALFYSLWNGAQFVLLGSSPDESIQRDFWQLKHELNDSPDCHIELGYNAQLARLIYAGADMIVQPSLYEPCGLTQLMALRYGTVPVVRAVGGLVDTVFDRDHSDKPADERNGYLFEHPNDEALESAMSRAIGLWYDYPADFRQLMVSGMRYDFSWNRPGEHYMNIYEFIRHR